jgi:hypothetical protein
LSKNVQSNVAPAPFVSAVPTVAAVTVGSVVVVLGECFLLAVVSEPIVSIAVVSVSVVSVLVVLVECVLFIGVVVAVEVENEKNNQDREKQNDNSK